MRITHPHAMFSQPSSYPDCHFRSNGTHIDNDQPLMRALNNPARAKQHLFDLRRTGQHSNNHITGCSNITWSSSSTRPHREELVRHRLMPVLHNQGEACLKQIMSHRSTHNAQTNKPDGLRHRYHAPTNQECLATKSGRVIAPSEADKTWAAYFAKTPLV